MIFGNHIFETPGASDKMNVCDAISRQHAFASRSEEKVVSETENGTKVFSLLFLSPVDEPTTSV